MLPREIFKLRSSEIAGTCILLVIFASVSSNGVWNREDLGPIILLFALVLLILAITHVRWYI